LQATRSPRSLACKPRGDHGQRPSVFTFACYVVNAGEIDAVNAGEILQQLAGAKVQQ